MLLDFYETICCLFSFDCHSTSNFLVDWHCTQLEFGSGEGSVCRAELGLAQEVDQGMNVAITDTSWGKGMRIFSPQPYPASSLIWNKAVAFCEHCHCPAARWKGAKSWTYFLSLGFFPPSKFCCAKCVKLCRCKSIAISLIKSLFI